MLDKYTHISPQKTLKAHGFDIPVNIAYWYPNISNNYYQNGYSLKSSFLISRIRMTFTPNFNVANYGGASGGPVFV
jgi:hypothetical protein